MIENQLSFLQEGVHSNKMKYFFFLFFRSGSSSTGRGSSNSVAMSPTSDLAAQYVQVEVASPEDQQFIVYTEWKNKNNISFFLWKKMFIKITVSKKKQSAVISHYVESFFWKKNYETKTAKKKIFKKTFAREEDGKIQVLKKK